MTIVSTSTAPAPRVNTFWIAANIMFDLHSGDAREVLLLVNKAEDATAFTPQDAQTYINFVKQRAMFVRSGARTIIWSIEPWVSPIAPQLFEPERPPLFVIKGVQYA